MIRSALFAVVIAVPTVAAAQDAADKTGSINRTDTAVEMTEHQVRNRLAKQGYTAIGSIERDTDGIWRTTAMKGDSMMSIAVNRDGVVEDR